MRVLSAPKYLAPQSIAELIQRAESLAGLTLAEFFALTDANLPDNLLRDKGTIGQRIEYYLGATAGTLAEPDFPALGVELKTIPVNASGAPWESTYVCHLQFHEIAHTTWHTSLVRKKLKQVLWIPIISTSKKQVLAERRIGMPLLWNMPPAIEQILQEDWQELTDLIVLGHVDTIRATQGIYLQIRPKAANSLALCRGIGEDGSPTLTLPRGFYLRALLTAQIIQQHYAT